MERFNINHVNELCELIKYENAVLFLGQEYQTVLGGENYFVNEINRYFFRNKIVNPSYPLLWDRMSEISKSGKKEGAHPILDDSQIRKLEEIGAGIPQNKKLSELLNIGWSSVITSSIDPGIVNSEGIPCNPIYNVNTRPAGIANKRKLHITYMFGCVADENSYPKAYKIRTSVKSNAAKMYNRVIGEAIMFSGALVIDGWNPLTDWASLDIVLGNEYIDADMPFPKIYLFSCSSEIKEKLYESENIEELVESSKLIVSENSLYESLSAYIYDVNEERKAEKEASETAEEISFQRGKKTIVLQIPGEQLRDLDKDRIHLLRPKDRMRIAYDSEGVRELTIKFLANSSEKLPRWQGYLQNCCFERDVYKKSDKTGLYDRVLSILQSPNLHNTAHTVILHGPSNSGKTVLLGKLALELSNYYPILFINGEIESDDPDVTRHRYERIVSFINNYLTRSPQNEDKIRAVVIWDNNAFIDKLQGYDELANELAESNTVLIGSAYEIRPAIKAELKKRRGIELIQISPVLNPKTELASMENMFASNLGTSFLEILNSVKRTLNEKKERLDLINDNTRLLSLLQRTFRIADNDITKEASFRLNRETAANDKIIRERFRSAIEKADTYYSTDINGLSEILKSYTNSEDKKKEWYRQLEICAPILNDLLAMAGQFGLRLPLNLVKKVLCDPEICPDIKRNMDAVDDILENDTMLEYPFPIDEVGHIMVGYRSPDEAETYLTSHYTSRESLNEDTTDDNEGREFLEDREIYLLEKIIEYSNLEDYSWSNWHTVTTVRELLDQYGDKSRKGKEFARRYEYKYDELASFILDHGGSDNPEMVLCAAALMREQLRKSMLANIRKGYNILEKEKIILNKAADSLEQAIEIENQNSLEESARLMRLYVEWCTNRNYTLDRENPSIKDIDLFYQIHDRYAKALNIYLRQKTKRMKPMDMLDVYLNGFIAYVNTMEKLYRVDSEPEKADALKLNEFTNELAYALNTVLGQLLDFEDFNESRRNLNNNIATVYKLANKSLESLKKRVRAHGSAAYILLNARGLWIKELDSNLGVNNLKGTDLYFTSDLAERPGTTPAEVIEAARKSYAYLKRPENLNVLLYSRIGKEKDVAGLEMLIRSAWIAKTGNMPFTKEQFPILSKDDWNEMHSYCKAYVESGNERARYAFAYYLEGIYYWAFTADSWDRSKRINPSNENFDFCYHFGIRPAGIFRSDSFLYLCEPGTGKPIKFNARIKRVSINRDEADITSAVDSKQIVELPYVLNRRKIYSAQSLQRDAFKTKVETKTITIRFNLEGALAGPESPEREVALYAKK